MTDIAAAIGLHQLRKAEQFRDARERCAGWYDEALADVGAVETPPAAEAHLTHAWHLYPIQLRLERLSIDRAEFIRELTAAKITTSVHWTPLHMHPYYGKTFGYGEQDFPVAHAAFERIISLPIFPDMTDEQLVRVARTLREILSKDQKPKSA